VTEVEVEVEADDGVEDEVAPALLADVAVPAPLPRALTYLVPDKLASAVSPGRRVLCTLGSRRVVGSSSGPITDLHLPR
jgi:hypothetical protein